MITKPNPDAAAAGDPGQPGTSASPPASEQGPTWLELVDKFDRACRAIEASTATQASLLSLFEQREIMRQAKECNAISREANRMVGYLEQPLHPLRGIKTNEKIPGFPALLRDIYEMDGKYSGGLNRLAKTSRAEPDDC